MTIRTRKLVEELTREGLQKIPEKFQKLGTSSSSILSELTITQIWP